jgi:hypothetical protein
MDYQPLDDRTQRALADASRHLLVDPTAITSIKHYL